MLLTLYFSLSHTYLNYEKLAWNSAIRKNLKKLLNQQKHAMWVINNGIRFDSTFEFSKFQTTLNIWKLNIVSITCSTRGIMLHLQYFQYFHVWYTQQFFKIQLKNAWKTKKNQIHFSCRGISIWNTFIQNSKKETGLLSGFKSELKLKLASFSIEISLKNIMAESFAKSNWQRNVTMFVTMPWWNSTSTSLFLVWELDENLIVYNKKKYLWNVYVFVIYECFVREIYIINEDFLSLMNFLQTPRND